LAKGEEESKKQKLSFSLPEEFFVPFSFIFPFSSVGISRYSWIFWWLFQERLKYSILSCDGERVGLERVGWGRVRGRGHSL
jgi:hypothetical protein